MLRVIKRFGAFASASGWASRPADLRQQLPIISGAQGPLDLCTGILFSRPANKLRPCQTGSFTRQRGGDSSDGFKALFWWIFAAQSGNTITFAYGWRPYGVTNGIRSKALTRLLREQARLALRIRGDQCYGRLRLQLLSSTAKRADGSCRCLYLIRSAPHF